MCKVHYDGCIVMNLSMDRANEGLGREQVNNTQGELWVVGLLVFLRGLSYTGVMEA